MREGKLESIWEESMQEESRAVDSTINRNTGQSALLERENE